MQARDEDDAKLALLDPVPEPMESHVQRLRHFGGDGVVGEAYRHFVIAENGGCGLRMTYICQNLPFVDGNPSARKDAGVFRLGDERAYYGDASRMVRDDVIKEFLVILMTEEMVRPRDASGFRVGEIRRIR